MKRTREEASKTRQDLLDAALLIFSRVGFEAARLEDIASQAGVTRGAIYHHFGGKEELFIALLDDASATSNKAIDQAIASGGSLLQILANIITKTFVLLENDHRFRQVMALSLGTHNLEELAQRRKNEAEQLVESISQQMQTGIRSGQLRENLDPANAARALLAYQNGYAMLWFSNPVLFSASENAEGLAEIFLYGIAR
jgi:TetR/AcrR family transcriptional regulator, acrAB operon repressor